MAILFAPAHVTTKYATTNLFYGVSLLSLLAFFVHFPCLPFRFFSSLRNSPRKSRSTSKPFVMNIHKLLPERVYSSVDSLHTNQIEVRERTL